MLLLLVWECCRGWSHNHGLAWANNTTLTRHVAVGRRANAKEEVEQGSDVLDGLGSFDVVGRGRLLWQENW